MPILTRILFIGFIWAIASAGSTAAWAANDRALVWKLTHEQSGEPAATAYIFGSIHLAKPELYPLRPEIEAAFKRSDVLVVELDIDAEGSDINQWMQKHGLYTAPESLRDHLPAKTLQRLQRYIQQQQLDEAQLLQQRPALLSVSLSLQQLTALQFDPSLGLDKHFYNQARQQNKKVLALETLDEQLKALFAFPDDALMIEQTLDQAEKLPAMMDELIAAWKTGDSQRLGKLLLETDQDNASLRFKPLMDALFYQRNHRMAEKLDQWLQSGGSYFVVVGSGHLVGEQNMIDLLRQRGYTIKRF